MHKYYTNVWCFSNSDKTINLSLLYYNNILVLKCSFFSASASFYYLFITAIILCSSLIMGFLGYFFLKYFSFLSHLKLFTFFLEYVKNKTTLHLNLLYYNIRYNIIFIMHIWIVFRSKWHRVTNYYYAMFFDLIIIYTTRIPKYYL